MWKEFKEFAVKGNAVDLAVGVIIGAAFGKIVTSIVEDLLMPPLGKVLGNLNFADYYFPLSEKITGFSPGHDRSSLVHPTGRLFFESEHDPSSRGATVYAREVTSAAGR